MKSFNKTLLVVFFALILLFRPSSAAYMRGKTSTTATATDPTTTNNNEATTGLRGLKKWEMHHSGNHTTHHRNDETRPGLLTDNSNHSFDITFYTAAFDHKYGLSAWGTKTTFYHEYNGTGTDGLDGQLGTAYLSVVDYNYVEGENTTDYLNDNTLKFVFDRGDMLVTEGVFSFELLESDFRFAITGGTKHFIGSSGQVSIEIDDQEILTWKFYFAK